MNPGQTAFFDSAVPSLAADDYQFVIEQSVTVDDVAQPAYGTAQRFRVTGPRTALAPADVVAVRPPRGASGAFESWLPHVVLAQRTLPWQVAPADDLAAAQIPRGTPWLAVLLLTSAEIDVAGEAPAAGTTGGQSVGIGQLLAPPTGIAGPAATLGLATTAAEHPNLTVEVVDIHLDAFRAVAPTLAELPLLTHVRQVDASDQEVLDVGAPGWYSVVVGNRFPSGAFDDRYIAHLVSLEGATSYLPGGTNSTTADRLRLVSLASWTFASTRDQADFSALAEALDVSSLTVPLTVAGDTDSGRQVAAAAQAGYAALAYQTRLGEPTTGWFRGPLAPSPIFDNPQPPYASSAAAMIYDPVTGMFDTSYAAAWEIGRLLTLANGPAALSIAGAATALVNAARLVHRDSERAVVRGIATHHPDDGDDAATTPSRRAIGLITRTVVPLLADSTRPAALGVRGDRRGLAGVQLAGMLDSATVRALYDTGPAVYRRVRDQVLGQGSDVGNEQASRVVQT